MMSTQLYGDLDPYLIHDSLSPPESSPETASRSVQPFLHRRQTLTVQSYLTGCVNVHPCRTHGSLDPPKSTTQAASRSVQLFFTAHVRARWAYVGHWGHILSLTSGRRHPFCSVFPCTIALIHHESPCYCTQHWVQYIITGSAHCCKAHSKINRKMESSTPCKIVTPESLFHFETWHTWLRRGGHLLHNFWRRSLEWGLLPK